MKLRAKDHQGMRVDYSGMLRQAREALQMLTPHNNGRLHAEMLRQLQDHLKEMGERFYAGDLSAVDEFLQLYCIARDYRNQPVPVDTEQAIQRCAAELPDGWTIQVEIEHHAGTVRYLDPEGEGEHMDTDADTMGERILDTLERVKEIVRGR